MIGQVLRISSVFAQLMASSALALSITIAIAGTVERKSSHCYACLHASSAFTRFAPSQTRTVALAADTRRIQV